MQTDFNLLINGSSRAGSTGDWVPVLNPATEETIGRVAYASSEDLSQTIAAASRGTREWRSVAAWERGRRLKKAADLLRADVETAALTLTREQGKPLAEARDEVERSADFLEWGGEQARRISDRVVPGRLAGSRIEIQSHPIGVVAAFTPWNFPMALAAKKFAGALGAGCSIICKPSQGTPGSVLVMAKALLEAGVTPSALAVIFGHAEEVASRLITARETAKVTFTGSIPIGKRSRGATVLTGGNRLGTRGYFYAPTVLADVPDDAAVLHEEPFGPIAPIIPFTDETDMLRRANGLEFGLASYVITNDVRRQQRLIDALEYGVVGVNGPLTHHPEASLGGWKDSGIDTEGGIEILDPYQTTKHVSLREARW